MWSQNGASSAGLLPGRETIGPLALMVICPIMGLLMTDANMSYGGSFTELFSRLLADPLGSIASSFKTPSWETVRILAAFAAFELALMRLVPGKRFVGPISPTGHRPVYNANGFQCFLITVFTFLLGSLYFGWFSPTIVYDHYAEMITALTVSSLAAVRPTSATWAPSEANSCAVQRPMPLPPPVTTTVWPSNKPGLKTERYDMFPPDLNSRSPACI